MAKFSKAAMIKYLEKRIESLVDDHGVDIYNGSAKTIGAGTEFKIAYGEYVALRTALLDIDGDYIGK